MLISKLFARTQLFQRTTRSFSVANESSFLEMVREYIDKAGQTAGIPKDRINFLKSPDFSLKLYVPFRTGTPLLTQTQDSSKSSKPIVYSTNVTDFPPREAPATPMPFTLKK